jgi:hypothetical protein
MIVPRMTKEPIRIAIGYRLYDMFCVDCNAVLMTEDEHLQQVQCDKCGRMFAYRLPQEKEEACLQYAMTNPQMQ